MPSDARDRAGRDIAVPSMLDLVRLSPRRLFPPGGVDLYRHIALLTELSRDQEVLDVACGPGTTLEYFVKEHGVHGSGVDYDPAMVERAEDRARDEDLAPRLQFQHGDLEALPYRDEIFDVAVGEMGLTAHAEPQRALSELVRVTKPGGTVVLVQLVWKAPVDERRRELLSEHLGARPLMLVELKRILRESGVRHLHTEDWSDEETAFRKQVTKPFPDFAELFSLGEKLGILRRAWRRWGWSGVKTALLREREVHRLLTRERIIGLDLLMGTKAAAGELAGDDGIGRTAGVSGAEERDAVDQTELGDQTRHDGESSGADRSRPGSDEGGEKGAGGEQTVGLPLFGADDE